MLYLATFLIVVTKHLIRNNLRKVLFLLATKSGNKSVKPSVTFASGSKGKDAGAQFTVSFLFQAPAHALVPPTLRVVFHLSSSNLDISS